jgi:uncharacterized protein (TIGR00369 family)
MVDIPDGFQPHLRRSPVTEPWEPLFARIGDGVVELAFEVRQAHCNGRGLLHGGVMAALCDNAMGLALATTIEGATSILTLSLSVDYLGSARVGELVVIASRVVHGGRSVATCDAMVLSGERRIARANANFSVREAKP